MLLFGCGSSGFLSSFDDGGALDSSALGSPHGDATTRPKDSGNMLSTGDVSTSPMCVAKTCAQLNASCGPEGDGCGGALQCGVCSPPETCGGGGVPNVCGAVNPDAGEAGTVPTGTLTISPLSQSITVAFGQQTPTLTYSAEVGGQSVAASFSLDLGQLATINPSTGVLIPSGALGGVAHVTATFGAATVSTAVTLTVQLSQSGAASSPDAGADAGEAGGSAGVGGSPAGGPVGLVTETLLQGTTAVDPSLSCLSVQQRRLAPGILAPLLQWSTTTTYDAVYIQLEETGFSYQGFFSAPVAGQPFVNMPIQPAAWNALVYSNQADPVTVTLVFSSNGVAYGPISETWLVAQGTLTGTVYYQSYGTALAVNYPGSNGYPNFGGATLAIKHGATSPVLIAGTSGLTPTNSNCRVCHSVAAGGSALITQHGDNYDQSSAFSLGAPSLEAVMPPLAPPESAATGTYAFPAIYPDGHDAAEQHGPSPRREPSHHERPLLDPFRRRCRFDRPADGILGRDPGVLSRRIARRLQPVRRR